MLLVLSGRRLIFGVIIVSVAVWLISVLTPPVARLVSTGSKTRRVPIYQVARDDNKVSISLDATWGTELTDEILDILDENGVKTTFFLAGYWVAKHPDYVRKIVERGHEIGNHSHDHPHMNQMTKEQIKADLSKNHEMLKQITGQDAFLFRPPFGEYSDKVIEAAEELGYYTIQWSIDSLDWKEVSADFMVQRVMEKIEPGAIVLFHNAGKHTPQALRTLLPRLNAQGYDVVPISELIYRDDYYIEPHSGVQKKKPSEPADVPVEENS